MVVVSGAGTVMALMAGMMVKSVTAMSGTSGAQMVVAMVAESIMILMTEMALISAIVELIVAEKISVYYKNQ